MEIVRCPVCGLKFLYQDRSHNCKAISEYGMCLTCMGYCPYCLDFRGLEDVSKGFKGSSKGSK